MITDNLDKKGLYDVCIVGGLGHIGLPLGVAFANVGIRVVLLDINNQVLEKVKAGIFPFKEYNGEENLKKALASGNLEATLDPSVIKNSEIIITVIGTPIDEYLNPNFSGIVNMVDQYMEYFKDGQILLLRSTVYPGTSERIYHYIQERGKDVGVAFCPERIVQGNAFKELKNLPQIISAFDDKTLKRVEVLFTNLEVKSLITAKPIEAELAKLLSNTWRYISFAIANQFFMIASDNNINYHNVYDIMTKDYDRAKNIPKPGFAAGPCLLKDTMQLSAFSGSSFFMGHSAMLVNEGLPAFIINKLVEKYPNLSEKTVGILGMAFKAENDDHRDSLSFKVRKVAKLHAKKILCHDHYMENENFCDLDDILKKSDVIILSTPHDLYLDIDPEAHKDKIFVDIWNKWGRGFIFET